MDIKTIHLILYPHVFEERRFLKIWPFFALCGIIRIRGSSIFVEFLGSPLSRIYILDENKTLRELIFSLKLKTDTSTKSGDYSST